MKEKRKFKRLPINLELAINELFKQDNDIIEQIDVDAHVINISKDGIGFKSDERVPLDYYFDCKIQFDDDDYFYGVLKVIREEEHEEGFFIYGCQFIGLAGFLAEKVDKYEKNHKD